MPAYPKVAVAGATGNLGPSVVRELVNAGIQVTTISRSGKTDGLPSDVKTVKVDYGSQDSLVSALQGHDAVVSLLPKHDQQDVLIDAAIAAGVKRFLPSEFGSNIAGNSATASLPVFAGKAKTQKYLESKKDQISYTYVVNGLFLDWGLGLGLNINLKGPTNLYDGGNVKFSTTLLSDVGKAVVGILKHPDETKDRAVYVQSASVTQNELLEIAKKVKPGYQPETNHVDVKQLEEGAYEKLRKGEDVGTAYFHFIVASVFRPEFGSDWSAKNDNELLGIKELSQKELEEVVAKYA
ncbi:NAD(P)-binding [Lecanosticta acicola]|uniref:NAD(P)-binding n=1 Tax=Lecanosticta acicola TaxID=111012 RepID=A0AAI8Z9F6_9PEZI|nr:NAD(P)-binding [Lecanosticta acicola]